MPTTLSPRRHRRSLLAAGTLALAGGLACAPLAGAAFAAGTSPAHAAATTGMVRFAQLSPSSTKVDVYVDNKLQVANAPFTSVVSYRALSAGKHTLAFRPAGAPATSAAEATKAFTVVAGHDYTAAVLGTAGSLTGSVFDDPLVNLKAGTASVRLLHAAPGVPAVDVTVNGGKTLFDNVAYDKPTSYRAVGGGSYDVTMAQTDTHAVLWVVKGVAVKAGSAYTLAAVGGAGRPLQVLPLMDSASIVKAPVGGVQTGLGGTATGGIGVLPIVLAGGGVAALAGGVLLLTRRRDDLVAAA